MINPYTGKMDWEQIIQQALQSFMMMKFFKDFSGKDKSIAKPPATEPIPSPRHEAIPGAIQGMAPPTMPSSGGPPGMTGAPGPMGQLPPELMQMLMMLMQGGQM